MPQNVNINERFNLKYGLRVDIDIATVAEVDTSIFYCRGFIQANKKFPENNLIKFI
ncbi:MAG: hypothetical protein SV062_08500 [Thermodesulfobacteriota bacterium]|nr:hypothetical protein [Thermodesulfobacteriota bacterium]